MAFARLPGDPKLCILVASGGTVRWVGVGDSGMGGAVREAVGGKFLFLSFSHLSRF